MIFPDIKSAIRNILRNKVTSAISILGLGIGLGCILALMALIVHEKSSDRFIPGYRNVYRIIRGTSANTQYPLAESMANDFPEVKDYFRYYLANSLQMKSSDQGIARVDNFYFPDPSVFRIPGIKFINVSSLSEILIMLNSDFIKWVPVAIIIAIPVSVYLLSAWLKRFACKTDLSWWLFGPAAISAIIDAVLTVNWQSWKAATGNPVDALKYE